MKWASAISTQDTIEACIEEATQSIKTQLAGKPADLTVVFVSPHFADHYNEIPPMIRERMEPGLFFGCSGGGIIGAGQEVEQQPAFSITAAHLPGVQVQPVRTGTMELPDQDTGPGVWRDWLGVKAETQPHFIFLADPFSFRGEEFLAGMDFAYPNSKKIGGLASGAHTQGGNALYLGDTVYAEGLIGVALSGEIVVDTIVAQGCRPIGQPLKITQCQQNMLQKLDNEPPMEVLQEINETLNENDRNLMKTSLFLGIEMDPLKDDPQQGDFLIRNLMGVDHQSGALAIGAMLREGQLVQFHLRDKVMSAEDLDVMLSRYHAGGKADDACGALLFSCLGRGQYLYGRPNHDTDMFKDKMGAIPLGGFFCNGEIGPVGKATFLHGYTSSFGIFRPQSQKAE
ncbi:MAG: FIST C-terminal domain-containing protein [Nitrospinae bacterium]|jgi:small ligand-binding sensory domain FIST|nr:FIST C-terminal domain-containing protein [Nitrospinota bacterium]MDA1110696.1 FIST C-terminal domain-containing protein [Nitrospinota bacterium]